MNKDIPPHSELKKPFEIPEQDDIDQYIRG